MPSLSAQTMDQVSWQYKTLHPIKYIKIYHQSAVLPDTANYILEYYFIICQFLLCGHILVIYSSTTYSWERTINNFTTHGKNLLLHKTHFFQVFPTFIAYSIIIVFPSSAINPPLESGSHLLYMHYAWRHFCRTR